MALKYVSLAEIKAYCGVVGTANDTVLTMI